MTDRPLRGEIPAFLADPHGVVAAAVAAVEPSLSADVVAETISAVADTRAKIRRLAQAIHEAPDLLTSARPHGPRVVELLIRALLDVGATNVRLPECGRCHQPRCLRRVIDDGVRICGSCAGMLNATKKRCAGCRNVRAIVGADQAGKPLCVKCFNHQQSSVDYRSRIEHQLTSVVPSLAATRLRAIIDDILPEPARQREISWELEAQPTVLTTNAALGSHRLVLLAEALHSHGADEVPAPSCPYCGSTQRIRFRRDGRRCCRRCYDASKHEVCGRCGSLRAVASRSHDGQAICTPCHRGDPVNHEDCTTCGRTTHIIHRDGGQRLCRACWRGQEAVCSRCNKTKPCHFADTDAPLCEHCSRLARAQPCIKCGVTRGVWSRTPSGEPVCSICTSIRQPCASCGTMALVASRTELGALCKTCYRKDPASFRTCERCGSWERLYHYALCATCAAHQQLRELLSGDNGVIPPGVQPIYDALAESRPLRLIGWIHESSAVPPLRKLLADNMPVTHETLDAMLPNRGVQHLRAALVSHKILEERDEYLAALERWLTTFLARVDNTDDRHLLHRYATWHHLRKRRHSAKKKPLTSGQTIGPRTDLARAARFLTWLRTRGKDIDTCSQADIDFYLSEGPADRRDIRHFVHWASTHGHPNELDIPARNNSHRQPIEQDERWNLVKRLLQDEQLDPADRFAGLLVLLFGQHVSRIVTLTLADVEQSAGKVVIHLGPTPLDLPAPLGDIALQLAANRRSNRIQLAPIDNHQWLFPGGLHGKHLGNERMSVRLNRLGIRTRPGRNAALIDLAAQLPAKIISELLGITVEAATIWSGYSGATRSGYAAELARNRT